MCQNTPFSGILNTLQRYTFFLIPQIKREIFLFIFFYPLYSNPLHPKFSNISRSPSLPFFSNAKSPSPTGFPSPPIRFPQPTHQVFPAHSSGFPTPPIRFPQPFPTHRRTVASIHFFPTVEPPFLRSFRPSAPPLFHVDLPHVNPLILRGIFGLSSFYLHIIFFLSPFLRIRDRKKIKRR